MGIEGYFSGCLTLTLPCIALKTPVLSIVNKENKKNNTRWDSYSDMLHYTNNQDFLSGNFDFDFHNPPQNSDAYLPVQETLIREAEAFVRHYQDCDLPLEAVKI